MLNNITKKRTISQIMAFRKQKRLQKKLNTSKLQNNKNVTLENISCDTKADYLMKKTTYNNQDKLLLLKHVQRKYRIHFDHNFSMSLINVINIKQQAVLDKNYDSQLKSYFIFKGRIKIFQKVNEQRSLYYSLYNANEYRASSYTQVASFQGQKGIGKIFSQQLYNEALLKCINAVVLQIFHKNHEHKHIQKNCLMTFQEKQIFVMRLNLFKNLDNVNRYYIPFFKSRKISKGEMLYKIGQKPQFLYLIVSGQIEFQSKVNVQKLQKRDKTAVTELMLSNQFEDNIIMTTSILSDNNYFGQQQILSNSNRIQNAKCLSLSCLFLQISIEKVQKLLYYNQFRQILESTALQKNRQREKNINNFINLRYTKRQDDSSERKRYPTMNFQALNQSIYNSCSAINKQDIKISLNQKKSKIVHGNYLKIPKPYPSNIKTENFSMLEVNKSVFQNSLKKYRSFSVYQKNYETSKNKFSVKKQRQGRSLFKMWKVLNLHNILDQQQRFNVEDSDGMQFYKTYMRKLKHLSDSKSYRPKTVTTSHKVKSQYIDYLQNI